jgi:hypothetical protein
MSLCVVTGLLMAARSAVIEPPRGAEVGYAMDVYMGVTDRRSKSGEPFVTGMKRAGNL